MMTTTVDDIEKFQQFAKARLSAGGGHLDMMELAAEWQFQHASGGHLQQDVLAVKAALRSMDHGESGRSIAEFAEDLLRRNPGRSES